MQIIPATEDHHESIWEIFRQVAVAAADAYAFEPGNNPKMAFLRLFTSSPTNS